MSIPYVVSEAIWNAKAASETKELKSEFERCQVTVIEITTASFSGTLDIKGKLHELSAFSNVPYIRQDQASIQTPSVSQISLTTDTAVYRYVVLGYWRRLELVMVWSAGTITCGVAGSSEAKVFPLLPTLEPATVETPFTGASNVVIGIHKLAPAADFKLQEVSLHLSAAPTTSTQNLVITLDSAQGSAYDQVLLTIDLVANAITDLTIKPDRHFQSGDVITCAWTNTNTVTYGLVFKHQLE